MNGFAKLQTGHRCPEDQIFAGEKGPQQNFGQSSSVSQKAQMNLLRMTSITQNDMENVPFGLFALSAGLLFGKSAEVHTYAAIFYASSRVLHTVAYVNGWQPARAIF